MKYNTLSNAVFIVLIAAFAAPSSAQRSPLFGFRTVAFDVSWYEPSLSYYRESEAYQLDFSGSEVFEVQIEFSLLRILVLRGGVGYWKQDHERRLSLDDPENARSQRGTLDVVPLSAGLYHDARWLAIFGVRPVIGGGITQNLIQRTFYRERLDGSTPPEKFVGNGRDVAYFWMAGLHVPIVESFVLGFEVRQVTGSFEEIEPDETSLGRVSLDGFQYAGSLRYRLR